MVKTYLKYESVETFGLIYSSSGKVRYDVTGKYALTPCLQDLLGYDLKLGECTLKYTDPLNTKAQVTAVVCNQEWVVVGYQDGSLRLYRPSCGSRPEQTFHGHTSAISALAVHEHMLLSGSNDTHLVLWDLLSSTGVARLRGHKDQVTQVAMHGTQYALSASKDTSFKIWDLSLRVCVATVFHTAEIWAFQTLPAPTPDTQYLVMDAPDAVQVYELDLRVLDAWAGTAEGTRSTSQNVKTPAACLSAPIALTKKASAHRTVGIEYAQGWLVVASLDHRIDVFRVLDPAAAQKRKALKERRKRKKQTQDGADDEEAASRTATLADCFVHHTVLSAPSKVRSIALHFPTLLLGLSDNRVVHTPALTELAATTAGASREVDGTWLEHMGHRGEIRCVQFADDGRVATAGAGQVKVWVGTQCRTTVDVPGGVVSLLWVPGGSHLVAGTKAGQLAWIDVAAGAAEIADVHAGSVWALANLHDGTGFVSGGADRAVHFHAYGRRADTATYAATRTLKLRDEVLALAVSATYLAVALLDATVHVFFAATLAFKFTLYGHTLPVLSVAIADDEAVVVTAGADKSLKRWGTDFGDLHVTLHAHTEPVTCVRFLPHTHYVLTASRDRQIKFWDTDTRTLVDVYTKHQGEVWALDVSADGTSFVSCANDRSVCVWAQTDHVIVPEDVRDAEVDVQIQRDLQQQQPASMEGGEGGGVVELAVIDQWIDVLGSATPARALVDVLDRTTPADLDTQLLLLPSAHRHPLLTLATTCTPTLPLCRFVLALLRTHPVADPTLLRTLQTHLRPWLEATRGVLGRNHAACRFLMREKQATQRVEFPASAE